MLSIRHNPAQAKQVSDIISRLALSGAIPPRQASASIISTAICVDYLQIDFFIKIVSIKFCLECFVTASLLSVEGCKRITTFFSD